MYKRQVLHLAARLVLLCGRYGQSIESWFVIFLERLCHLLVGAVPHRDVLMLSSDGRLILWIRDAEIPFGLVVLVSDRIIGRG